MKENSPHSTDEISQACSEESPESVKRLVANLIGQIEQLVGRVEQLEQQCEKLKAQNQLLKEQGKPPSQNSSKPHSQDIKTGFKTKEPRKSCKNQGAQPEYDGYECLLYPIEQCQNVEEHHPNEYIYYSESLPPLFSYSFQKQIREIVKAKIQELKSFGFIDEIVCKLRRCEVTLAAQEPKVIFEKIKSNEIIQTVSKCRCSLIILGVVSCYLIPAYFFAVQGKISLLSFECPFQYPLVEWFLKDFNDTWLRELIEWVILMSLLFLSSSIPIFPLWRSLKPEKSKNGRSYKKFDIASSKRSQTRSSKSTKVFMSLIWFIGVEILYIFWLSKALNDRAAFSNPIIYSFLSGTQALVLYLIVLFFLVYIFVFFRVLVVAWTRSRQVNQLTNSLIASQLSKVLILGDKSNWTRSSDRGEIIRNLIQISRLFKFKALKNLEIKNKNINDKYSSIGNYVESLTIWVALPKEDTKQYFCDEIAKILRLFLNGDWDALLKLSEGLTKTNSGFARLNFSFVLKSISFTILPLIGLLLIGKYFQVFGLDFLYKPLLLCTFSWAVINVLTIVDPELREKAKPSQVFLDLFNKFLPIPK